jgi:hypothetical protein
MHFNEFLQLNETEQVELLWYNGEQIGRRKEDDYLILLYQVEGFYVEVFYHRKERVIKKYSSFDCSDRRLQPYLEKIDISPIYKHTRKPSRISEQGLVNYFVSMAMDKPYEGRKHSTMVKRKRKQKRSFWNIFLSLFQISKK